MLRRLAIIAVTWLAAGTAVASPGAPLQLGVAPHASARAILAMYQPLRHQLERALGEQVEVVTAPDFDEFARRALAGEYDLAVTTGHQARLLQADAGWVPLVTYAADFRPLVATAAGGAVRAPQDLRGRTVLGFSPASLVTLWGERWLRERGLGAVQVRYVGTADNVAHLVASGEAGACFLSLANFRTLPDDLRNRLRILDQGRPMAGRVYLLSPRRADRRAAMEAALWGFAASEDGRAHFEEQHLEGFRRLATGELRELEPYAAEVRARLRRGAR